MAAIGLFASWLGTLCWNEASQRLPTALVGQLIVFETLAALAYAYMLRGQMPQPLTLIGIGCLIVGVARRARQARAGGGAGLGVGQVGILGQALADRRAGARSSGAT